MLITELLIAFTTIFLMEFLDKTQIMVIVLASKLNKSWVFLGSFLALVSVGIISCFFGSLILHLIPREILYLVIGAGLIGGGLLFLIKGEEFENDILVKRNANALLYSYTTVFLAEFGDKTQLSVIALSVKLSNVILVILGVSLAFLAITSIGVLFGDIIKRLAESRKIPISLVAGVVFIVLGAIFILDAIGILHGLSTHV
ncbi:MAG: TMEM165/GDT1 family protein [Candidatus Njordarchaeales archaeon]